ncbi:phosphatidylethanolamine-binding protein [Stachybotrys elegans]|uniref:Phosphatidylethanolamine-binding protein n=1 Tax=Stachybotrys elegans TaxID=80388 RepID=A0A8K0WJY6_9HYPO|nr:phosphatidylethanolamine-binding protein [Stachybotrys elegans]
MMSNLARLSAALVFLSQVTQSLAQTPPDFSPSTENSLSIQYAGNDIEAGAEVSITDAATVPDIQLSQSNTSRVILMFDIDAPNGPANNALSPLLHWLIATPPGSNVGDDQSRINTVAEYSGPSPPAGSGPHRYVLLELENHEASFNIPSGFPDSYEHAPSRLRFDVTGFIEEGGFELLSATWFTAESTNGTTSEPESGAPAAVSTSFSMIFSLACVVAMVITSS